MRSKFRVVGLEAANVFEDLEALRQAQSKGAAQRRPRLKETFARIPHDRAKGLRHIGGPAWVLLIELDRLILKGRGRNPVKLTNRNLKAAGVVNHTKVRALRQLAAAGIISIEPQGRGKAPLVTHLWFPLQD